VYPTRQWAAWEVTNRVLVVAAIGAIMLSAGCSAVPVATWRASAPPSSTPGPAVSQLPGFSLSDPPPVIDHGPRTGNHVALTFDSNMTMGMRAKLAHHQSVSYANVKVLDILEQQHVPATFFLTGLWVEQYPAVTRRIAANPDFELANHTYSDRAYTPNCYSQPLMPAADMAADIVHTFNLLRLYGGNQTDYFRFPGLCSNRAALTAISSTHVTVIKGDVVSGDPFATAFQPIVTAVLARVRAGSIVIMHITKDNARMTDQALPPILAGLRQRGLVPVRLSQLLARPGTSTSPTATMTDELTQSTDPANPAAPRWQADPCDSGPGRRPDPYGLMGSAGSARRPEPVLLEMARLRPSASD
jgi:peptidoglycan/xylan/chitin deacetylase (PgdA/CDA1 family)